MSASITLRDLALELWAHEPAIIEIAPAGVNLPATAQPFFKITAEDADAIRAEWARLA